MTDRNNSGWSSSDQPQGWNPWDGEPPQPEKNVSGASRTGGKTGDAGATAASSASSNVGSSQPVNPYAQQGTNPWRGNGGRSSSVATKRPINTALAPVKKGWPKGKELAGLLILTVASAVMLLWNLSINKYGNEFYSAASQAGSKNWTAFLFGSSDWGNTITVDKTPLSLWPSAIAIKIFGLNSWSLLVPYAILGVISIVLLWFTVRRYAGSLAAFSAGVILALTPVAAVMFRFNNPDAMLVMFMTLAVWAGLRCIETGKWKWAVFTGVFIGLGFLAKQAEVLLVLPALGVGLLLASPRGWGAKIGQLFAAAAAMVVSAGWYVALVSLWPASSRPYIGGSTNNSIWELTLGYNGLSRLNGEQTGGGPSGGAQGAPQLTEGMGSMTGSTTGSGTAGQMAQSTGTAMGGQSGTGEAMSQMGQMGSPGGGGSHGPTFSGEAGLFRLFNEQLGGQTTWLLITAVIALVVGLVLRGRAPLKDTKRAAYVVFGLWLAVCAATFSFMEGTMHQYYTVAMTPAIAALVGMGIADAWEHRDELWVRITAAAGILAGGSTAIFVLSRFPSVYGWLRWIIASAMIIAAVAWVFGPMFAQRKHTYIDENGLEVTESRTNPVIVWIAGILAGVALLAGPAAYTAYSINHSHTGSMVAAGPETRSGMGGPGGMSGGMGGPGSMSEGGSQSGTGTMGHHRDSNSTGSAGGSGSTNGMQGMQGMQNGQGMSGMGTPPSGTTGGMNGQMPGMNGMQGMQGMPGMNGQNGMNGMNGMNGTDTTGQGAEGNSGTSTLPGTTGESSGGVGQLGGSTGTQDGDSTRGGMSGGMGGMEDQTVSTELQNMLKADSGKYEWSAATISSTNAAKYQLATDTDVMPIGGFSGNDPAPTLSEFKKLVSEHKIHYFIASGGMGRGGDSEITQWVEKNFTAKTVDGVTIYDLTTSTTSN